MLNADALHNTSQIEKEHKMNYHEALRKLAEFDYSTMRPGEVYELDGKNLVAAINVDTGEYLVKFTITDTSADYPRDETIAKAINTATAGYSLGDLCSARNILQTWITALHKQRYDLAREEPTEEIKELIEDAVQ